MLTPQVSSAFSNAHCHFLYFSFSLFLSFAAVTPCFCFNTDGILSIMTGQRCSGGNGLMNLYHTGQTQCHFLRLFIIAKVRPLARIVTGTDTLRPGPGSPAALWTASGANVHGEQRPHDPATLVVALAASPRGDVSQATCTVKALSDVARNTDAHMHAAHAAIWGSFPLRIENSCGRSFHVPRRARRRNAGANGLARSTRRQITGEGGHTAP